MEIKIGPYILSQRTSYSKFRLFDTKIDRDITDENEELFNEILSEYQKQTKNLEDYFDISDDRLISIKNIVIEDKIKYLFIPEFIKILEPKSLMGGQFKYVSIPNNLIEIGKSAFENCSNLKDINLPNTIQCIEGSAFKYCESLEEIILPNIDKIDERVFSRCYNLKKIYIPSTVKSIGNYAFFECNSLKNINLLYGLKTIGKSAFYSCSELSEIKLPDTLNTLKDGCFQRCTSLKNIELPNSIDTIPESIFENCTHLEQIVLPDKVRILHNTILNNAKVVRDVNIPAHLEVINGYPFGGYNIKSLTFYHDLKELCIEGFNINGGLLSGSEINTIRISNSVKTITPIAFRNCSDQVKTIEYFGTKKEFDIFKNNNEELFKVLSNVKEIHFLEEKMEDIKIEQQR